MVTRAAGILRKSRGETTRIAKLANPTAKVGQRVRFSLETNSTSRGTILPEEIGKPKIFPIWPSTMLKATPFRKPTRIGFDKKSAAAPSFRKLAATQMMPAKKVSVTEREA